MTDLPIRGTRGTDGHSSAHTQSQSPDVRLQHLTKRHNVHHLVYFEPFDDIEMAIAREKRLKDWDRDWKKNLIERDNPTWRDLYDDLAKA